MSDVVIHSERFAEERCNTARDAAIKALKDEGVDTFFLAFESASGHTEYFVEWNGPRKGSDLAGTVSRGLHTMISRIED